MFTLQSICIALNAIPLGTLRRVKPVNTGSQKHVTEKLKNAEKNPKPSGDLIPHNMQSRHAPEEPVFAHVLHIIMDCSGGLGQLVLAYPYSQAVKRVQWHYNSIIQSYELKVK